MTAPGLVPLPGLHRRCGSAEALAAARRLAAGLDPHARLLRLRAAEGLEGDGTASRWEIGFDLPERTGEAEVVITFVREEASSRWGGGVGAVGLRPFPASGSELERMVVRGEISRRRLPGLWRQQLAEHRPLPAEMPTAAAALGHAGLTDGARVMEAVVTRNGGPVWRITTPGGEVCLRFRADAGSWRFLG